MNWYQSAKKSAESNFPDINGYGEDLSLPASENGINDFVYQKALEKYHNIIKYSPDHDKTSAIKRAAEYFGLSYEDLLSHIKSESKVPFNQ